MSLTCSSEVLVTKSARMWSSTGKLIGCVAAVTSMHPIRINRNIHLPLQNQFGKIDQRHDNDSCIGYVAGDSARGGRTIVSSRRSRTATGFLQRPVCTGDVWMLALRGATSQWNRSLGDK